MIGLDTNVLARYYIDDEADVEAVAQREAARRLIEGGGPLMVCKSVVLELEWVMRGYYRFGPDRILPVLRHLLSLPQVRVEDRSAVERALTQYAEGLDFADSLHHASYSECEWMATFDDHRFARRATRAGMRPPVSVLR